jgi:ubiquinone/menaquinone biosynthesis C-methylase UbiE
MDGSRIVYDDQAHVFEDRAGLPDDTASQVAEAVRRCGRMGPDDLLVEIGAGTGVIGQWLARPPWRYLGVDSSQAMLDVFSPRLHDGAAAELVHADADQRWPVETGTAAVIFGSRVLHLLEPAHAVREAFRVAHPGGATVICGRLEHSRDSPRARARAKLRQLLSEYGLSPSATGGRPTKLLAQAEAEGATPFPSEVAAVWSETVTVTQVIDWWRGKTSIGGINPPPAVAGAVLAALTRWSVETYGERPAPVTTETRYLLEGVRLPAAAESG